MPWRCQTARPELWHACQEGAQGRPGVRPGWFLWDLTGSLGPGGNGTAPRGFMELNVPMSAGADPDAAIQASMHYCPIMYIMSLWLGVDLPLGACLLQAPVPLSFTGSRVGLPFDPIGLISHLSHRGHPSESPHRSNSVHGQPSRSDGHIRPSLVRAQAGSWTMCSQPGQINCDEMPEPPAGRLIYSFRR